MYFLVSTTLGAQKTLCGLWWQEGPVSGCGQFPLLLRASVSTSKMGLLEEVLAGQQGRGEALGRGDWPQGTEGLAHGKCPGHGLYGYSPARGLTGQPRWRPVGGAGRPHWVN